MKRSLLIIAALGAALIAGCGGESALPEATGKGTVRAINTIASSPEIAFLIEERQIGSANYKSATAAQEFDDLDYTFNFEVQFPTGRQRVANQFLDVVADRDYVFVISGALASPTITLLEAERRIFGETETVFEVRFGHFGTTLGDVDVYFADPGTTPMLGQQIATLSPRDSTEPVDYPEGEYELIYTVAGDPATVLFTSDTLTPTVRTAFAIGIFDADENELGQVSVRFFSEGSGTLFIPDVNAVPTVRFHHATMALATADIYNDDPAMFPPIVMNHAFRDVTGDIPVLDGTNSLTYTAAGDTAVILFENDLIPSTSGRISYYIVGETDNLGAISTIADRRPVETLVKFSFLHAAYNHTLIDFYIVEADGDIADVIPSLFGVPPGTAPLTSNLRAGSFDLYMTVSGEKTVITGPVRMDVALGDIVDVIAYDNVDPAIADLVFIPLP